MEWKKILEICNKTRCLFPIWSGSWENLNFFEKYDGNSWLVDSVLWKEEKLFSICIQTGSNAWVLVWKEENLFIFNLTFGSCRSLYGAKKIFHSIVGSNGIAWVVKVWKEKPIFFIINLANRYLFTLYGAGKEISTIFIST